MSVQFEWQVGTDDGDWETVAQTHRRPRRKWPRWVWGTLLTVIAIVAVGGYIIIRRRYDEARQRVEFQIQSVINLEARAFAQGDRDLFLAQQDEDSPDWYTQQTMRSSANCLQSVADALKAGDQTPRRIPKELCAPVLPAKIQDVDLQGDVAWVEVIEGQEPVRRARFYRQTETGWKHTAPRIAFWKTAVELKYGNMLFRYHRRDEPHIEPLIEHIFQTFNDVCTTLGCPSDRAMEVNFTAEYPTPTGSLPHLEDAKLALASPWLSGVPIDDRWTEDQLNELEYWVAYEAASQFTRADADQNLNRLQRVIAAEYAAWYSQQDTAQAPILGRIVERRGPDVLPSVLLSLRRTRTLTVFMVQWLSLSPTSQETAYFETLLNIEREALLVGQRETFLFLQNDTGLWLQQQARFFDQAQSYDTPISLPVAQVQTVERIDDRARVTLKERTIVQTGQASGTTIRETVFFRRRDGDWKRTSPADAAIWGAISSPTPTPTPDGNP